MAHSRTFLRRGVFQDLDFSSCIRFANEDKENIQDVFYCSSDSINYLNFRSPTGRVALTDKKDCLRFYLFESIMQKK